MAQIGNHTVISGPLTAFSVGEAEFCAVVKEGQVGLSLRPTHMDLGITMKFEIQGDSSTVNSFDGSVGSKTSNDIH